LKWNSGRLSEQVIDEASREQSNRVAPIRRARLCKNGEDELSSGTVADDAGIGVNWPPRTAFRIDLGPRDRRGAAGDSMDKVRLLFDVAAHAPAHRLRVGRSQRPIGCQKRQQPCGTRGRHRLSVRILASRCRQATRDGPVAQELLVASEQVAAAVVRGADGMQIVDAE
jgi:hypothetical protein